jgi:succinate-semialdehyde dehydrogenase/glutarate-semialdehyde dehydrogenase
MGTRKIGPAVAAGCTMVVKPASETPLSMLALAELMKDAGLPDGVLNVITSARASAVVEPLLRDPRTRKLSFTGSTPVGRTLMQQGSARLLRMSLELGGNAPFIVMDDADVDAAVEGAMLAKLRNIGQSCVAANRFLVHDAVHEEFATKLASRFAALTVGRGTEDGVDLGPLISAKQRDGVAAVVRDALDRGATPLTPPTELPGTGYFSAPTVLTDVPVDALAMTEEIFGPVAPIVRIGSEAQAVELANSVEVGLASYVYTRDLARALRMTEALEFGMTGINRGLISNPAAPFGGVKQSGMGREGGSEGIDEYLSVQYASLPI